MLTFDSPTPYLPIFVVISLLVVHLWDVIVCLLSYLWFLAWAFMCCFRNWQWAHYSFSKAC